MPKNCAAITIAAKHGQLIKVKDYTGITNTVGALRCRFEFRTSDWDNAVMTAVFCKGNMATHPNIIDTAIGVLLDDDNECAVPAEVLVPDAKHFSVGVWGVTASGLRIVSEWLVFNNKDGCYVDSAAPVEPTPTLYEQIMMSLDSKAPAAHEHDDRYYPREKVDDMFAQLDVSADLVDEIENNTAARHEHSNKSLLDKFSEDASGNPLYDGREISANVDEEDIIKHVEAALTEAKNSGDFDGANGETPYIKDGNWWIGTTNTGVRAEGVNGADGNNGSDGVGVAKAEINSNGELVVSYTNGQSANLGVVVGKDGADGKDGKDGVNGVDGQDGKDGISATHQWAGTILTVTSASGTSSVDLKGEKGDQGISGEKGADGSSAYDIWLAQGHVGTESDFLESLKGSPGPQGEKGVTGADGKDGVDGKSGVYVGTEEPTDGSNVWINPEGIADDSSVFATKQYVKDAIAEIDIPEGSGGETHPLTFTGAVEATYDGKEAVSVEIPSGGESNSPRELIAEITLEEETRIVRINKDLNGKDFRLKEFEFEVLANTTVSGSNATAGHMEIAFNGTSVFLQTCEVGYGSEKVLNANTTIYYFSQGRDVRYYKRVNNYGWDNSASKVTFSTKLIDIPITAINIYPADGQTKYKVGANFKLYGRRV